MFPLLRCLALNLSFLYAAQVAAADLAHPRTYCLGRLFEETLAQAQAGDLQASRQAVMLLQECDPSSPHIEPLLEYGAKHDNPDLTLGYIHHLEQNHQELLALNYALREAQRGRASAKLAFFDLVVKTKRQSQQALADAWMKEQMRSQDREWAVTVLWRWSEYAIHTMSPTRYDDAAWALHYIDHFLRTLPAADEPKLPQLRADLLHQAANLHIRQQLLARSRHLQ